MASRAKGKASPRVGLGVLVIAAAISGGCSVLFHADANQCTSNTDCASRGTGFTGFTCSQGTCIAPVATVTPDAGMRDATASMMDAQSNEGGAMCRSNKDCANFQPDPMHPDVACDVSTSQCIQLTSDQCPLIIGNFGGTDSALAPPIFLGAFVTIPPTAPMGHPTYLNYALALQEFQTTYGGIPAGPGTGLRMPVAIGCSVDGTATQIDGAWAHLINDVHVHSIVAPLASATLSHDFSTYAYPNNIFVINPLEADTTLVSLTTDGLLWHMLGQPSDNAPAYAAFLPLVEKYVRNNSAWSLGATAPMKVATVTAMATATAELSQAVENVLTWNGGQNIAQNTANGNYLAVGINDSTLNGTALTDPALISSIQTAEQAISAFEPDVVISFASEEFNTLIQNLELDWMGAGSAPFYLLGPYNEGSTILQGDLHTNTFYNGIKRFAGIGVASTTNQQVLSDYQTRFLTAFSGRTDALGSENYYDAMYFAVYSLVAAGRINAVGSDIASGMNPHLISLTSTAYDVGPADMGNIMGQLAAHASIQLVGALGPPVFDTATGARIGQGDVYCIANDVDGGYPWPYEYDVLRLVNADGGGLPDGGSAFEGAFSCYPGIQ